MNGSFFFCLGLVGQGLPRIATVEILFEHLSKDSFHNVKAGLGLILCLKISLNGQC